MTKEVQIMVGIPASGKSTWAKNESEKLQKEGYSTKVVSRDEIRKSMLKPGDSYFSNENRVFKEFIHEINKAIADNVDYVIADASHISPQSRHKTLCHIKADPSAIVAFEVFPIDTKNALIRNKKREGFARVPDAAIYTMAKSFSVPTTCEFPIDNYGFNEVDINIYPQGE